MCGGEDEETKDKHVAYTAIFGHVMVWHNEKEKNEKNEEKQDLTQNKWDSSYYN